MQTSSGEHITPPVLDSMCFGYLKKKNPCTLFGMPRFKKKIKFSDPFTGFSGLVCQLSSSSRIIQPPHLQVKLSSLHLRSGKLKVLLFFYFKFSSAVNKY